MHSLAECRGDASREKVGGAGRLLGISKLKRGLVRVSCGVQFNKTSLTWMSGPQLLTTTCESNSAVAERRVHCEAADQL